jgi:hypothetical protein
MPQTYLIWGDSAAGSLRLMNEQNEESHLIITMLDDLSIGVLHDVDTFEAEERMTLWKEIWKAQWYYDYQYDEYLEASLVRRFKASHNAILSLYTQNNPVVIWLGNNVHDRLMLAMCAAIMPPDVPLSVVDITDLADFNWHENNAIAFLPTDTLLKLVPVSLSKAKRDELRREWPNWKTSAKGWREINRDGHIMEHPVDHLDIKLLDKLSATHAQCITTVIGQVLLENPNILSSSFLFWRMELMRQNGTVSYLADNNREKSPPKVMLT